MSPELFLEGQFFEVEVESCNRDAEGKPKQGAEVYSTVTRILSRDLAPNLNLESFNLESGIRESPNQAINQSSCRLSRLRPRPGAGRANPSKPKGGTSVPLADSAALLS